MKRLNVLIVFSLSLERSFADRGFPRRRSTSSRDLKRGRILGGLDWMLVVSVPLSINLTCFLTDLSVFS